MSLPDTLTVLDHPLIRHKLHLLRERSTSSKIFRELVTELTMLMTYEVTRDLDEEEVEIQTPLETVTGRRLGGPGLVVVPILRAGLGMVDGVLALLPQVQVGHVGLSRDEESLEPMEYYFNLPPRPAERRFLVVDPMLATGGSATAAVSGLRSRGAERISLMCLVAAPEGVQALADTHPDLPIYAAALDRELDDQGFILPGLGDAGDRLYGT